MRFRSLFRTIWVDVAGGFIIGSLRNSQYTQCVRTQDHRHRLGRMAGSLALKVACRSRDLLGMVALESIICSSLMIAAVSRRRRRKKPTWGITLRCSATSAYSSTGPPAQPGCPSSSHPTTSIKRSAEPFESNSAPLMILSYDSEPGKASAFRFALPIMFSRSPGKSLCSLPFRRAFIPSSFVSVPR
jgi:hypothetical protein